MIQFDENLILKEASLLYKRARDVFAINMLSGFFTGFALGYIFSIGNSETATAVGAIGMVLGFASASAVSHRLKFSAQMLLCQLQIERNTRK